MSDTDVQALVLEQVRTIGTKLDALPGLQAKIDLLDKSSRETCAELRTRDHAQQQAIELLRKEIADLRLDQHKTMAGIAGVSSTTTELNASLDSLRQQIQTEEGQVRALYDTVMQTRRQINELDKDVRGLHAKVDTEVAGFVEQKRFEKLEAQVQTLDAEAEGNRPWINGIRWFLKILFYLAATAVAGGALYFAAETVIKALQ